MQEEDPILDDSGLFYLVEGKNNAVIKIMKNKELIEYEALLAKEVDGKKVIDRECYCKYAYLQCPLISYELHSTDSRIRLEPGGDGTQQAHLVIDTSVSFQATVTLRANFMNVMDSPSVSINVKVLPDSRFGYTPQTFNERIHYELF